MAGSQELNVWVEPAIVREHPHLQAFDPGIAIPFAAVVAQFLMFVTVRVCAVEKDLLADYVDFIVTFGGDGTILHLSSMFQREV